MRQKTLWSFEAPIKHLQDFDDLQDIQFTLSMLFTNPEYYQHMTQHRNKPLWLDNSYNEKGKADDPDKLLQLANEIHPDITVSPDNPKWPESQLKETFNRMLTFLPRRNLMLVAPTYQHYKKLKFLNPGIWGISYWNRGEWLHTNLLSMCQKEKTHFLGLLHPREIQLYRPYSCDTSMPIKLALQDMTIQDWVDQGCQHIYTKPDFFDLEMSDTEIHTARANIKTLKEI